MSVELNVKRISNHFENYGCKEWREGIGGELLTKYFSSQRIISDLHKGLEDYEWCIKEGEEVV